jgi:hypothetical protein
MYGLNLDGWAHEHLDMTHEGFFTPFHALYYSGFCANVLVVYLQTRRNHLSTGLPWRESIPLGYGASVAGFAVLAIGGQCDMLWHLAFGFERDLSAVLSPTHQLIALGMAFILLGPLRSTLARGKPATFRASLPALLNLALFLTFLEFWAQWTASLAAGKSWDVRIAFPNIGAVDSRFAFYELSHGILSAVVLSALMAGVVLYAARTGIARFGGATAIVVLGTLPLGLMLYVFGQDMWFIAAGAICAGLAGDLVLLRLQPFASEGLWRTQVLGFVIPWTYCSANLAATSLFYHGLWWEVHVVFGVPVVAGFAGVLLGTLTGRRETPARLRAT